MVKYYRTDDRKIHEEPTIQDGVWVQMVNPSVAEGQMVADALSPFSCPASQTCSSIS